MQACPDEQRTVEGGRMQRYRVAGFRTGGNRTHESYYTPRGWPLQGTLLRKARGRLFSVPCPVGTRIRASIAPYRLPPMKISRISTLVVNARMRNWVFVKVETDQPGLWGWGEASLEWKTRAVVGAVQDVSELLIGQDPRRIEHIWQIAYRQQFFKGGIVVMSAISGIDQALHDIKAKIFGVPLYEMLGGLVREKVRMYDHLGGG